MSQGRALATRTRGRFIAELASTGNVSLAALAAGGHRNTFYDCRAADPAFAAEWDEALEIATDALEAEARRRALEGVREPIVSGGKVVTDAAGEPMFIRRYSDSLMQLLLRAHRPEKFRERTETKLVGPDGGAVQVEAIRDRILRRVLRLAPGGGPGGDPE